MLGLYIHIPFCKSKCLYCDFVSFSGCENRFHEYINSLSKEMDYYKYQTVDTVFIGGGTPSVLPADILNRLLVDVNQKFNLKPNCEFTIEVNPGTLTLQKAEIMKSNNINRISFGLQSTVDTLLKKLGRIHNYSDFLNSYNHAKKAGIENISCDLMYNLPDQTVKDFGKTLDTVLDLDLKHISAYSLKIEKNTPFYQLYIDNKLNILPDDEYPEFVEILLKKTKAAGINRYEVSNFAKKGYECKHNINYWENGEYIGLGCAAYSYIDEKRMNNTDNLDEYISKINNDISPVINTEIPDDEQKEFESIMCAFRLTKGLNYKKFNIDFKTDFMNKYQNQIKKFSKSDLLNYNNRYIFLTEKGFNLMNSILIDFIQEQK